MSEIRWNPQRQLWETDQADLFSERQEPFSETWPTSGMTLAGRLYPLPASAHPTAGNESSSSPLLPSVRAAQGETRNSTIYARATGARGNLESVLAEVPSIASMLPTPRATDGTNGGPNQRGSSGDLMLPSAVMRMATSGTVTGTECPTHPTLE